MLLWGELPGSLQSRASSVTLLIISTSLLDRRAYALGRRLNGTSKGPGGMLDGKRLAAKTVPIIGGRACPSEVASPTLQWRMSCAVSAVYVQASLNKAVQDGQEFLDRAVNDC